MTDVVSITLTSTLYNDESLSARRIRSLKERWLTDADALADNLCSRGESDVAGVFAAHLPDAVGLGQEGREDLLPYPGRRSDPAG